MGVTLICDLQITKEYNDYSPYHSKTESKHDKAQETVGHLSNAHVQKLVAKCEMELETNLPYWFLCKDVK